MSSEVRSAILPPTATLVWNDQAESISAKQAKLLSKQTKQGQDPLRAQMNKTKTALAECMTSPSNDPKALQRAIQEQGVFEQMRQARPVTVESSVVAPKVTKNPLKLEDLERACKQFESPLKLWDEVLESFKKILKGSPELDIEAQKNENDKKAAICTSVCDALVQRLHDDTEQKLAEIKSRVETYVALSRLPAGYEKTLAHFADDKEVSPEAVKARFEAKINKEEDRKKEYADLAPAWNDASIKSVMVMKSALYYETLKPVVYTVAKQLQAVLELEADLNELDDSLAFMAKILEKDAFSTLEHEPKEKGFTFGQLFQLHETHADHLQKLDGIMDALAKTKVDESVAANIQKVLKETSPYNQPILGENETTKHKIYEDVNGSYMMELSRQRTALENAWTKLLETRDEIYKKVEVMLPSAKIQTILAGYVLAYNKMAYDLRNERQNEKRTYDGTATIFEAEMAKFKELNNKIMAKVVSDDELEPSFEDAIVNEQSLNTIFIDALVELRKLEEIPTSLIESISVSMQKTLPVIAWKAAFELSRMSYALKTTPEGSPPVYISETRYLTPPISKVLADTTMAIVQFAGVYPKEAKPAEVEYYVVKPPFPFVKL